MDHSSNILVTGGGGFLGKAIIRKLVARGERVRSFSRNFYPVLDNLNVEQVQGDLSDAGAVTSACAGIETVFHVAAKAGVWGKYQDFYHTNVNGTRNVIAGCQKNGVHRLIYTSSPSVIFDGSNMRGVDESVPYPDRYTAHYPHTKAMAEQNVLQAVTEGLSAIILRPHLIWGPEDNHLVPRIIKRAKRLRRVGDGNNLVDTIYIDNAALAHILAADKLRSDPTLNGKIYFISQDEPIALWDMVDAILHAADLEPVRKSIPAGTAKLIGLVLEFIHRILPIKAEPQMTRFLAKELSTDHWFDISAAKQDLGYLPRVSTRDGLEYLRRWLRNSC
jgi:nucleoside-diphosphate-sugar epimerase